MRSTICKRSGHRRASPIDYLLKKRPPPALPKLDQWCWKPRSDLAGVGSRFVSVVFLWCRWASTYLSVVARSTCIGIQETDWYLSLIGIYDWWAHIILVPFLLHMVWCYYISGEMVTPTYSWSITGHVCYFLVHGVLWVHLGWDFRVITTPRTSHRFVYFAVHQVPKLNKPRSPSGGLNSCTNPDFFPCLKEPIFKFHFWNW